MSERVSWLQRFDVNAKVLGSIQPKFSFSLIYFSYILLLDLKSVRRIFFVSYTCYQLITTDALVWYQGICLAFTVDKVALWRVLLRVFSSVI